MCDQSSRFMNLPTELQSMTFSHCIPDTLTIVYPDPARGWPLPSPDAPALKDTLALLFVSKHIRALALHRLSYRVCLRLDVQPPLEEDLITLDPDRTELHYALTGSKYKPDRQHADSELRLLRDAMVRNERAKRTISEHRQLVIRASNSSRSFVQAREALPISLVFMLRCRSIELILNNFSPDQLASADLSRNYRRCLSHLRSFLVCRSDIKCLAIQLRPLISLEESRTPWRAMERTCEAVLSYLKMRGGIGMIQYIQHLHLSCEGFYRHGFDTPAGDEKPLSLTQTRLEKISHWCALDDFIL